MSYPSTHIPSTKVGNRRRTVVAGKPRSVPITEWPNADRKAWLQACQPGQRLKRGGAASHLAPVSQADIARRYGMYLDFLQRMGMLSYSEGATSLVTRG